MLTPVNFQSPTSSEAAVAVSSVIVSVVPSLKAADEPLEILLVVQLPHWPTAKVAPDGSTVIWPPTESPASAPSVQPEVVGLLKSKSAPALSQIFVVVCAATVKVQPLLAALLLLT